MDPVAVGALSAGRRPRRVVRYADADIAEVVGGGGPVRARVLGSRLGPIIPLRRIRSAGEQLRPMLNGTTGPSADPDPLGSSPDAPARPNRR